jgi:Ser/Thr protein kinase RdoA (MazF antagonist)
VVAAVAASRAELAAIGAGDLPVTLVHGDFHEGNVHYLDDDRGRERLAGVIDFGLTHLDSRPYELAIARSYRSPELRAAYRDELTRQGWPLSPLEVAAIEPLDRAFRVDMVAWQLAEGLRLGRFATDLIERHLARTGVPRP